MPRVTAAMVKELREATGCGMAESKRYLEMAEGDMEIATEIVRYGGYAVMCYVNGEPASYAEIAARFLLDAKKEKERSWRKRLRAWCAAVSSDATR